jgi:hypothetical protein
MTFTSGAKVYVSYSTDITGPTVELLTIKEFKNDLLYFQEKSSYYAVECHVASFYGYSRTLAGKVLITKHRWQLPFAALAEKMAISQPAKPAKKIVAKPALSLKLSKVS